MTPTVALYGIPNCDQVKKAKAWLATHGIVVHFNDFKKIALTPDMINAWLKHIEWQHLLNRRGTTWRQLSEQQQLAVVDANSAVQCMVRSPSVIKRPVLVIQNTEQVEILVGFSEDNYRRALL